MTMRHKYQAAIKQLKRDETVEVKEELDPEQQIQKELDEALVRLEKDKKRQAKKDRELKAKTDLRQKMSVIATSTGIDNDEELNLNSRLWSELQEKGFEKFEEEGEDEMSESSELQEEESEEESGDDSDGLDDKQKATERMAQEMEDNINEQREYASRIDRKMAGKELKKK